jgi:predicted DNA-binding antitoxin AbrB/MazE fold protein
MTKTIRAIYSKGKIEPLEELELEEGKEVTVTISDLAEIERRAFLKLPMDKRRKILATQSAKVASAYVKNRELEDIGGGNLLDY